ncbi:hypothetical protein B0T24DRAFT_24129 [Lasiosphaeria ovina]|uniref:Plant heme peroxidase family profile domain-containing protein n=1 Tax=Lasiosphaeria ovina TaxID=92902 RepID=A0AAE0NJX1_9PEZI|nr:hypothetical protein B0T24DRAFT_24129 [Lasiosphaeria ovina]
MLTRPWRRRHYHDLREQGSDALMSPSRRTNTIEKTARTSRQRPVHRQKSHRRNRLDLESCVGIDMTGCPDIVCILSLSPCRVIPKQPRRGRRENCSGSEFRNGRREKMEGKASKKKDPKIHAGRPLGGSAKHSRLEFCLLGRPSRHGRLGSFHSPFSHRGADIVHTLLHASGPPLPFHRVRSNPSAGFTSRLHSVPGRLRRPLSASLAGLSAQVCRKESCDRAVAFVKHKQQQIATLREYLSGAKRGFVLTTLGGFRNRLCQVLEKHMPREDPERAVR